MRMSHVSGYAVATLMLTAVGLSVPAAASAVDVPDSSAVPSVVSSLVPAKKPATASHKQAKAHKPHKASPGAAKHSTIPVASVPPKHHPPKHHLTKRGAKTSVGRVGAVSGTAVVAHSRGAASPPVRRASTPPAPAAATKHAPDVMQQVAGAVQDVYSLFGWNLIALIPLTAIAFAISRQMRPGRRSADGPRMSA